MRRMASLARDRVAGPTVRSVIVRFAAGTLVAILIALVGGYFVLRSVAIDEAKRQTRTRVQEEGRLVEATLSDGLLKGKAKALQAVDDAVVGRVLSKSIVRVKIWSAAGRVLYSDESTEIGGQYALDEEQHRLLRNGGAEVEVTDLNRAENALDRQQGRLIEAYTRIRTPSGTPLLFEIYQRFGSVTAGARRLLETLAPPILGAIGLILLVQAPLFWSLMRRLQLSHEQREGLLANAVTSSRRERRRVASYLHDGPVQELAGLAFSLAPVADNAEKRGADREGAVVRTGSTGCAARFETCVHCWSTSTRRPWRRRVSRRRSAISSVRCPHAGRRSSCGWRATTASTPTRRRSSTASPRRPSAT
jgi:two-component system, NarL family, sensor kinase